MPDNIDDYLIDLSDEKKIDYLTIHQFIMECSPLIVSEKKYNVPFYTCSGLLLYINFDKKVKQFYIGFCLGYLLDDCFNILCNGNTRYIKKWYYKDINQLEYDEMSLKKLILASIEINRKKTIKI